MNLKYFYNFERQNLSDDLKKDFEFLVLEKLKINRIDLNSEDLKIDNVVVENLKSDLEDLKSGKPLAYILKSQFFLGYEFYVDPRVLIPRSETEYLVDFVLKEINKNKKFIDLNSDMQNYEQPVKQVSTKSGEFLNSVILDAGAGSGCIGISILLKNSNLKCIFVENSKAAIEVININLEKFKIKPERYVIIEDMAQIDEALIQLNSKKLDLFISNPPYIANDDPKVQASVLDYEPHSALFCEDEGLYYLKQWSLLAKEFLNKDNGFAVFEFGQCQENFLQTYANQNKMKSEIINDQYGRPRFWKITP